jgi:hypothetical protein
MKMGFLTVSVITAQTFQAMTNREKGVPLSQLHTKDNQGTSLIKHGSWIESSSLR